MRILLAVISTIAMFTTSANAQEWTSKIKLKGDFRLRTEQITLEDGVAAGEDSVQLRQRIRFRLGINAQINDVTEVIARVATGSTANNGIASTNQSFDDYDNKKAFNLDLAYVNWKIWDGLEFLGGKSVNPYWFSPGDDILFDTDVTLEGMAFKYKGSAGEFEWFANAGASWVDERVKTAATPTVRNADVMLYGAQAIFNYKPEGFNVLVGVAAYNFANIKGATANSAEGNSLTGAAYTFEYNLTSIFIELGASLGGMPVAVFANMVTNSDPETDNTANIFGVRINKLTDPGTWALTLDSRKVEKDGVVGIFTDSDAADGGTDQDGIRASFGYQVGGGTMMALNYYQNNLGISGASTASYQRVMLDANFSF